MTREVSKPTSVQEQSTDELVERVRAGLPFQSGVSNNVPVWRTSSPSKTAPDALAALAELVKRLKAAEQEEEKAWDFEHKMMERATEAEEKLEGAEASNRELREALRRIEYELEPLHTGANSFGAHLQSAKNIARAVLAKTPDPLHPPDPVVREALEQEC